MTTLAESLPTTRREAAEGRRLAGSVSSHREREQAIADDLQHLLLDARRENPMQSAGRVKQLMMKWHHLLGGAAGAAAS